MVLFYIVLIILIHMSIVFFIFFRAEKHGFNGLYWMLPAMVFAIPTLLVYLFYEYTIFRAQVSRKHSLTAERILNPRYKKKANPLLAGAFAEEDDTDGFRDEDLESLIADSKFEAAEEHIAKMLKVAKDVGEKDVAKKYARYATVIEEGKRERDGFW